jgi:hypothetical protein
MKACLLVLGTAILVKSFEVELTRKRRGEMQMTEADHKTEEKKPRLSTLLVYSLGLALLAIVFRDFFSSIDAFAFLVFTSIVLIMSCVSGVRIIRSRGRLAGGRLAICSISIAVFVLIWEFGGGMLWHKHLLVLDLKRCDSLKVYNYHYGRGKRPRRIIDEYLVTDDDLIGRIAGLVYNARFYPHAWGRLGSDVFVMLETHRGRKQTNRVSVFRDTLQFPETRLILGGINKSTYSLKYRILKTLPQTREQTLRNRCERNLGNLEGIVFFYRRSHSGQYPKASHWCDQLLEYWRGYMEGQGVYEPTEEFFNCPAAPEERRSYSINPYCGPNSPNDVVFLFESKPGWNQFGGPELLTTENHGGEGCHIIFNDPRGHAEFVIPERFSELKWKSEQAR